MKASKILGASQKDKNRLRFWHLSSEYRYAVSNINTFHGSIEKHLDLTTRNLGIPTINSWPLEEVTTVFKPE